MGVVEFVNIYFVQVHPILQVWARLLFRFVLIN